MINSIVRVKAVAKQFNSHLLHRESKIKIFLTLNLDTTILLLAIPTL